MKWLSLFKRNKEEKRYAIIDIGDSNFEYQVIRRSYKTPVMVDFWASWCVPCRQLGPVLERIAEDPKSEFILAKLNTESNKRSAAKYQIRSIPAVKMFRNGQVIGEFTGNLPESTIRKFADEANKILPPPPPQMKNLDGLQRVELAKKHLRKGRGFEAFLMLDGLPETAVTSETDALTKLAKFIYDLDDGDALTGLDELDQLYQTAVSALRKKNPRQAIESLNQALEVGEEIDADVTMNGINGIFALLGEDHKLTKELRSPQ
ncbi:MAG: thioredoxin domain-containing protein [Chloroflexota bacterium]